LKREVVKEYGRVLAFEERLRQAFENGDIQDLAEIVFEIKDQGLDKIIDVTEAEEKIYGDWRCDNFYHFNVLTI